MQRRLLVLHLLSGAAMGFHPAGATHCPNTRFGMREWTHDTLPVTIFWHHPRTRGPTTTAKVKLQVIVHKMLHTVAVIFMYT